MQALILEDDPTFQAQMAQALMGKGFNVLCVETLPAAEAFLRLDMADVLVFGERIGGRLSHTAALLAECRNPLVAAVLLTDRTGPELDELFDLMPSLVGILGRRVAPEVVTQVVMAAVSEMASDTVRGRLAARWSAAESAEEGAGTATDAALPEALMVPAPASFAVAEPVLWEGERAPVLSRNAGLSPLPEGRDPAEAEEESAGAARARAWLASLESARPAPAPAEEAPAVAAEVVPGPQPAVIARPLRPSANSALARVMSGGRTRQTEAAGEEPRPRGPLLPAWFAPRAAESGAPAAPAAPSRPPLPRVTTPDRRLNLA